MKINSITVKHELADIAHTTSALESCLINFSFTDQVRHAYLQSISEVYPSSPVFLATAYKSDGNMGKIQVIIDTPCSSTEDIFSRACTEETLAEKLRELRDKNIKQWQKNAYDSAKKKLPSLPEAWHELFESIPKSKHLSVMCILLAEPRKGTTREEHHEWIIENIQSIIDKDKDNFSD